MTSIVPQPSPSQSTVSHPNMTCSLSSNATTEHRPTVSSRPKLTLQTSSLPRTFGTSSTGLSLSLAGGATASPTVRNTFKNAYDAALPSSATASPSKTSNSRFSKPSSPYPSHNQNSNNPYQLPLGVKSILRNSPLEPTCRLRSASVATSANGGTGSRRVFFPAKKQVNYRQPLEEEIQNVHYTARHSDIAGEPAEQPPQTNSDQDSDSNSSLAPSDTSTSDEDDSSTGTRRSPLSALERKKRKHLSAEKQVRAVALMDGLEDNYGSTTPQTPRQKRVKRRCEWRWTLGPLNTGTEGAKPPPSQDETPSDLATTKTVPVLSNPVPKWVSKDVESPASASDLLSASSAASLPYSSPSSSVASEVADKNDEYWKTTSHEPERANADPPE
ncbi:hypothetical protein P170DRAFT_470457 [Aspergillus steynii IBT 23096]|uniref:Uncharacterized protein n=1 Tax=Aspergillus steynii IBT 23096 TaxID=1392250 RepID=A0A2I2GQ83_9EURO|nr:uncharacterized protein P170DRAFT_470457 [Aspergillus steynii IBT 23096]PLB55029.1 hypothetical protein P170DRAFT_470457 [Aspergillus steynii IBT 23096]